MELPESEGQGRERRASLACPRRSLGDHFAKSFYERCAYSQNSKPGTRVPKPRFWIPGPEAWKLETRPPPRPPSSRNPQPRTRNPYPLHLPRPCDSFCLRSGLGPRFRVGNLQCFQVFCGQGFLNGLTIAKDEDETWPRTQR